MLKKFVVVLMVLALLLNVVACNVNQGASSSDAEESTSSQEGTNVKPSGESGTSSSTDEKKIVRISIPSDAPSLDPQGMVNDVICNAVANHMLEGLVRTRGNDILPGMAEKWEISEDGLVYTFHLRDAVWSDGVPVTANDFMTSFKRLVNPKTASATAMYSYVIKNAKAINQGEKDLDTLGIRAIDEKTFEVTLENPTSYFLTLLGKLWFYPVREDILEKYGNEFASTADKNVYNGPFAFTEWRLEDKLTFEKNDSYWDTDSIKLDGIEFYIVKNSDTAASMLDAGELDLIYSLSTTLIPLYGDRVKYYIPGGLYFIRFNLDGSNEFTANKNFRKAFYYAFDRNEYLKLRGGKNEPMGRVCLPYVNGVNSAYGEEYPYNFPATADLDKASSFLDKALNELGLKSASDITLELLIGDSEGSRKEGVIIQDMMLKNLGIHITVKSLPRKDFLAEHKKHNYEIITAGWAPDYNDPYTYLEVYISDSPYNHGSYNNPIFDDLMKKANETVDPKERMDMLFEAEKILLDDVVECPTNAAKRPYLINEKLKNVFMGFQSPKPDVVYAYFED